MEDKQLTLMDGLMGFSRRRKASKAVGTLSKIDGLVDWRVLADIVSALDRSRTGKGGRPPIGFEIKLKMMFLQHLFNLSDEELEDQFDRTRRNHRPRTQGRGCLYKRLLGTYRHQSDDNSGLDLDLFAKLDHAAGRYLEIAGRASRVA